MKLSAIGREKLIDLKIDIAGKILVLNKYALLIILEERENIKNLADILNKKKLFIEIIAKIKIDYNDILKLNKTEMDKMRILKKIISDNINIEKNIIDKFSAKQKNLAEKIKLLRKIGCATKAYESNTNNV
jgi:ribosomal protein S18